MVRRSLAPPGGGSSFSFGYDEPASPPRSQQPASSPSQQTASIPSSGGRRRVNQDPNRSQWSFGGEEDEEVGALPLSHKKKFPVNSGGGRASIDLTGAGEVPLTPSSRRVLQPVGGASSISLVGEGEPAKPSIRPLQSVGGNSSISLAGDGKAFDSYSVRPLQRPGGESSINLTGEGAAPAFFERRPLKMPGGDSTISLSGEGEPVGFSPRTKTHPVGGPSNISFGGDMAPESPRMFSAHRTPPGGRSSISFGGGDPASPIPPSFQSGVRRLAQDFERLGVTEENKTVAGAEEDEEEEIFSQPLSESTIPDHDYEKPHPPHLTIHLPVTPPESVRSSSPPLPARSQASSPSSFRNHHASSIQFGDDGPMPRDSDFSPKKKFGGRRPLGPHGGGSSSITFG
ncbi:hypothetical protein HDU67_007783 [Dinochytrium kinnereticum]|nr:hypothetical protein HDU67_007783 [Dinochytrium kinnereticum]